MIGVGLLLGAAMIVALFVELYERALSTFASIDRQLGNQSGGDGADGAGDFELHHSTVNSEGAQHDHA